MTKTRKTRFRRVRVILGSVVGLSLAGATLFPWTGWLVRQQAQTLFTGPVSPQVMGQTNEKTAERQRQAAASYPGDFPLQMALALRKGSGTARAADEGSKLASLHRLESTFSSDPSLYAAMLRTLLQDAVRLGHRMDQFELEPGGATAGKPSAPIRAADLTEWLRIAERGASLDPDNAYFPLMKAIGFFAGHRDTEALAEIKRAGTLPRFEDYVRDEATGGWALAEAGQKGEIPTLSRAAISAATVLPHYAVVRASARLTVVQAVRLEREGNVEEGFAIRQALMRCGARMRTDSNWLIGNFVGEAIAAIAQARPGGAPSLPRVKGMSSEERAARRAQQYNAYLSKIGHSEEIPWVEHGQTSRKEIRSIVGKGLDKGPSSIASLMQNMVLWAVGIALLGNMLWIVLFGAAATWLAKTGRIRRGEPLPAAVTLSIGLSTLALAGAGTGAFSGGSGVSATTAALAAAVGFGAALLHYLRRGRKHSAGSADVAIMTIRQSAALAAAATASVTLISGLLYWTSGSVGAYTGSMNAMIGFQPTSSEANGLLMRLLSVAAVLCVPFLTWVVLAIASRIRRVPVSVGTVRGFARVALPITAVLSLLYVVLVGVTSVREAAARQGLAASVQHEGRACAAYTGRVWPSFAP